MRYSDSLQAVATRNTTTTGEGLMEVDPAVHVVSGDPRVGYLDPQDTRCGRWVYAAARLRHQEGDLEAHYAGLKR